MLPYTSNKKPADRPKANDAKWVHNTNGLIFLTPAAKITRERLTKISKLQKQFYVLKYIIHFMRPFLKFRVTMSSHIIFKPLPKTFSLTTDDTTDKTTNILSRQHYCCSIVLNISVHSQ